MDLLPIILQGGAKQQEKGFLTLTSHQDGSEVFLGQYSEDESAWKTTGLYSFNNKDWMNFELNGDVPNYITLDSNEKMFVKILTEYDPDLIENSIDNKFSIIGKIECSGDLLTSLYVNETEIKEGMFRRLFMGCTGLIKAPKLPATTLATACYLDMFNGCTSLTEAPKLPATTLALECYTGMFSGCTSLTEAPKLPATTLATECYTYMFYGCTGLTKAPSLPATSLSSSCYDQMFYGCTGLTKAPELPATNLVNFCYNEMFSGCSSLNDVTIYANNISASYCISSWLLNVAATGTFHNLGTATYTTGTSGIPSGWTEVHS